MEIHETKFTEKIERKDEKKNSPCSQEHGSAMRMKIREEETMKIDFQRSEERENSDMWRMRKRERGSEINRIKEGEETNEMK